MTATLPASPADVLEPCPFCGGKAIIGANMFGKMAGNYYVRCENCGGRVDHSTRRAAIEVWNMRHRSSPSSAWRVMAEMNVADRTRGTFWLAGGDAKELAYFNSGWGNWLNAYTDKQIKFVPTHYLRNELPPLPEPPK